jgi:hypothetical protein
LTSGAVNGKHIAESRRMIIVKFQNIRYENPPITLMRILLSFIWAIITLFCPQMGLDEINEL